MASYTYCKQSARGTCSGPTPCGVKTGESGYGKSRMQSRGRCGTKELAQRKHEKEKRFPPVAVILEYLWSRYITYEERVEPKAARGANGRRHDKKLAEPDWGKAMKMP